MNHCLTKGMSQEQIGDMDNPAAIFATIRHFIFQQVPPPTPVLYTAVTNPFPGYVSTQNTPKPPKKHPFSWPKSGQNEIQSGQNGPQQSKFFEKWAKLFRSGHSEITFIHLWRRLCNGLVARFIRFLQARRIDKTRLTSMVLS